MTKIIEFIDKLIDKLSKKRDTTIQGNIKRIDLIKKLEHEIQELNNVKIQLQQQEKDKNDKKH